MSYSLVERCRRPIATLALPAAFTCVLATCSSDSVTGPGRTPAVLTIASGDSQPVVVAEAAAAPLIARVLDEQGAPLGGVAVSWDVMRETHTGDWTTDAAGALEEQSMASDASGIVRAGYLADTVSGTARVRVAVTGANLATAFAVLVRPGAPHSLVRVTADAVVIPPGPDGVAFEVRVQDQFSNPVPDVEVLWTAEGARQAPVLSAPRDTSDADGIARAMVQSGGLAQAIEVSAALPSATPGAWQTRWEATTVTASGTFEIDWAERRVLHGSRMSTNPPRIRAFSSTGTAADDVEVSVRSLESGVVLEGVTAEPTVDAVATFDELVVRGPVGDSITLIFEAAEFEPVSVRALMVRPQVGIEIVSGDGQTVELKHLASQPFLARVVDADGAPLANVSVVWRITSGLGTLWSIYPVSDSDGLVQVVLHADTVAGPVEVMVTPEGTSYATFHAQIPAGAPRAFRIVSGDRQTYQASQGSEPLVARAVDQYGNPTPGVAAHWRIEAPIPTIGISPSLDTSDAAGLLSTSLMPDSIGQKIRVWLRTDDMNGFANSFVATAVGESPALFVFWGYPPHRMCNGPVLGSPPVGAKSGPGVGALSRTGEQQAGVPITVSSPTPGVVLNGTLTRTTIARLQYSLPDVHFADLMVTGPGGDSITLVFEAPDHIPASVRALLLPAPPVRMVPGGLVDFTHTKVTNGDIGVTVRLLDAEGRAVPCAPVLFQQPRSSHSVILPNRFRTDTTISTDIDGYARGYMVPDTTSPLIVSRPGLEGSPATFKLRFVAVPGPPYDCTTGARKVFFGDSLVLRTRCFDYLGVPAAGRRITWTSDGASIDTPITETDAYGWAENTIRFDKSDGLVKVWIDFGSTDKVFNVSVTRDYTGKATRCSSYPPSTSITVGATMELSVTCWDPQSQKVANVTVNWSAPGAEILTPVSQTNIFGVATTSIRFVQAGVVRVTIVAQSEGGPENLLSYDITATPQE